MIKLFLHLLHVLRKALEALGSLLQGAYVFAESESGVRLSEVGMFLAVKLARYENHFWSVSCGLTSLTGIDETPTSMAMNQHALKSLPRPRTLSGKG